MIIPRPYQSGAIECIRGVIRRGRRRILVVAPTGSGKTTIAAIIVLGALAKGRRTLFMAHRRELISQCYYRLLEIGVPAHELGIIMAQDHRTCHGAMVQVASVQSLARRAKPLADIVITDECHRCLAPTYRDLATYYSGALHLGLTATPYRADGGGLGERYDELVVVSTPQQHIDEGYLVAPRVYLAPQEHRPDMSGVRKVRGEWHTGESATVMDTVELNGGIVSNWRRLAGGASTVTFAVNVTHSRNIMAAFTDAGISAEHLDAKTPGGERDAILARLKSGETTVVSNCDILSEGWDMPSVKCAVLARPTQSLRLYLQQAGRILRPYQGQDALILDHAGNVEKHGLPQDEREFTLDPSMKKEKKKKTTKVCPQCNAVMPIAATECPECGHKRPPAELKQIKYSDAELEEYTPVSRGEWIKELRKHRTVCAQKGYKEGWVYHRMMEKFGRIPAGYRW